MSQSLRASCYLSVLGCVLIRLSFTVYSLKMLIIILFVSVCVVHLCVRELDACGVWQDSVEHSEEPSDLLRPTGSQHLLCHSRGTHLLPNAPDTARGFTEQVHNSVLCLIQGICSIFTSVFHI